MVKIFKDVRAQRNESLLNILGLVATAKKPISPYTIKKMLGKGKAYSGVHKNVVFLEERGFLWSKRKDYGRKERLCDVTIKGSLASLFASSHTLDHSKLLEQWREKDWGSSYNQPFKNIKDASEIKKFVETLYLYGGSLEEVNEDILKIGLRNPEEALQIITTATLTVRKKIEENGKYEVKSTYIPDSVQTQLVRRRDGSNNVCFVVAPDGKTGELLFDFLSRDQKYRWNFGAYLLTILQVIARDLSVSKLEAFSVEEYKNLIRYLGKTWEVYLQESARCAHDDVVIIKFSLDVFEKLKKILETKGAKSIDEIVNLATLNYIDSYKPTKAHFLIKADGPATRMAIEKGIYKNKREAIEDAIERNEERLAKELLETVE